MRVKQFELDSGMKINNFLLYISTYTYVILACILAVVLQLESVVENSSGSSYVPLWKQWLGV